MTPGAPGQVDDATDVECQCGSDRFHVAYKAPVYAVVEAGAVVHVVVDDENAEGPLVSECAGCGRSDVVGDAGAAAARIVAETRTTGRDGNSDGDHAGSQRPRRRRAARTGGR